MERHTDVFSEVVAGAVSGVNELGSRLLAATKAEAPDTNVVCSPVSVALALAMALGGAAGETATEIATLLGVPANTDRAMYHNAVNALADELTSRFAGVSNDAGRYENAIHAELNIANSLWGQVGVDWRPSFLQLLGDVYGAPLETVDFVADPDAARASINRWVEQATKDRIRQLLGEGSIDTLTRLVLINAIYLKASWTTNFFGGSTTESAFATSSGPAVDVAMMHSTRTTGYAIGNGWRCVELCYVVPGINLTAVVASDDTPVPSLADIDARITSGLVELSFPRFGIETTQSLSYMLYTLGLSDAFTRDADFSAITNTEPLHLDDVIHRANISVDEDGTEAAAATAVAVMAGGAFPVEDPVVITFNRPFTFWLRDSNTGTVIFTGYVADPSSS